MPFALNRKDNDDPSDRGMGGDTANGHESSDCPQSQATDGDTEMAALSSGTVGSNNLAAAVQALLLGRAVTPLNHKPRSFCADGTVNVAAVRPGMVCSQTRQRRVVAALSGRGLLAVRR